MTINNSVIARRINAEELRIKQAEFEGTRQDLTKILSGLEKKRKNFIVKFPQNKIREITLSQYAIGGENSKKSFCYIIENGLKELGNIHGATADKFGIYFGKRKSDHALKYRFVSKFGNNETIVFENIKNAIFSLLESAQRSDPVAIEENLLSPMFKGKILSTYYPEKFLNIFADEHLDYFLDTLGIYYNEDEDEVYKRQLLVNFKNGDLVMSRWTIFEFSKFLYAAFGRPPKKEEAPEELKDYIEVKKEYLPLSEVAGKFIELKVSTENISHSRERAIGIKKVIDFEREHRINKLLGDRGEEVVFNLEKLGLEKRGKKDLAEKVKWVSRSDDSLGYDILSFEDDGEEKYIEVKSTAQSVGTNAVFGISINQYSKAKELKNYYFYIVFETKTANPKIWKIKSPLDYENKGLVLTPIKFRAVINIGVDK